MTFVLTDKKIIWKKAMFRKFLFPHVEGWNFIQLFKIPRINFSFLFVHSILRGVTFLW